MARQEIIAETEFATLRNVDPDDVQYLKELIPGIRFHLADAEPTVKSFLHKVLLSTLYFISATALVLGITVLIKHFGR